MKHQYVTILFLAHQSNINIQQIHSKFKQCIRDQHWITEHAYLNKYLCKHFLLLLLHPLCSLSLQALNSFGKCCVHANQGDEWSNYTVRWWETSPFLYEYSDLQAFLLWNTSWAMQPCNIWHKPVCSESNASTVYVWPAGSDWCNLFALPETISHCNNYKTSSFDLRKSIK